MFIMNAYLTASHFGRSTVLNDNYIIITYVSSAYSVNYEKMIKYVRHTHQRTLSNLVQYNKGIIINIRPIVAVVVFLNSTKLYKFTL